MKSRKLIDKEWEIYASCSLTLKKNHATRYSIIYIILFYIEISKGILCTCASVYSCTDVLSYLLA